MARTVASAEQVLTAIAEQLERGFNGDAVGDERDQGFMLITFPLRADWKSVTKPIVNFISNGKQADVDEALKNYMESKGFIVLRRASSLDS